MVIYIRKLVGRVARFFGYRSKKQWKDIEYFNPNWKERIKIMSEFIDPDLSVTDFGCGKMWLKEYLNTDNKYIPIDYIDRGEGTIICDFNNYEFPNIYSNVAFISGCLEYIKDYEWFVKRLSSNYTKCIVSYCITENFPNISERKEKTWVNSLSEVEILDLFRQNGFELKEKISMLNMIFVFEK